MATRDTLQIIAGADLKMDIHRNDLLNQDKKVIEAFQAFYEHFIKREFLKIESIPASVDDIPCWGIFSYNCLTIAFFSMFLQNTVIYKSGNYGYARITNENTLNIYRTLLSNPSLELSDPFFQKTNAVDRVRFEKTLEYIDSNFCTNLSSPIKNSIDSIKNDNSINTVSSLVYKSFRNGMIHCLFIQYPAGLTRKLGKVFSMQDDRLYIDVIEFKNLTLNGLDGYFQNLKNSPELKTKFFAGVYLMFNLEELWD